MQKKQDLLPASIFVFVSFLPREWRDATQSAALPWQVIVRPSVCLPARDVEVGLSWSYRLEFLENNFTADWPNLFTLYRPNITDLLQGIGLTPKF